MPVCGSKHRFFGVFFFYFEKIDDPVMFVTGEMLTVSQINKYIPTNICQLQIFCHISYQHLSINIAASYWAMEEYKIYSSSVWLPKNTKVDAADSL